jgi:hypothetical protein
MQVILRRDGSKCVHRAGTMRFSGSRWQYGNFTDFELRKDDPVDGPVVASSSKAAICLLDTDPIRSADNRQQQYVAHCTDPIGRMGISSGYKDTYSRVWPGQWIDLDADPSMPVEPGMYYLSNIVDPNNHFWEKDDNRDDNANYSSMRVGLADPDAGQPPPTPAPQIAPTVQPARTRPVVQRTVRPRPVRTVRPRSPRLQRTPRAAQPQHPVRPTRPPRNTPARHRPDR